MGTESCSWPAVGDDGWKAAAVKELGLERCVAKAETNMGRTKSEKALGASPWHSPLKQTWDLAFDVSVNCMSQPVSLSGPRMRVLYDWVVAKFPTPDLLPNTLEVTGGGFGGGRYLDFARGRKRLEATDFALLSTLGVHRFKIKQSPTTIGWSFTARALGPYSRDDRGTYCVKPIGLWDVSLCMFPDRLGTSEGWCVEAALEFARLAMEKWGALFFMQRNRGPDYYVLGMSYTYPSLPSDRTYEEGCDITSWSTDPVRRLQRSWLRDVYPMNFLGPELASMPVEDSSLSAWLRNDPCRGSLEPFPCEDEEKMLLWKPPLARIPELRERLYRAGLIWHYHHSFSDSNWKPQDPPPTTMRAEFYKGRDPKLTR